MSTTTPRLSLLKAAPSDVVDVVADIDDAFDKIDAAAGFQPVTSFPGSPYTGKAIQRTDLSDKPYFYQATAGRFANIPFDTFFAKKSADQIINNTVALVTDADLNVPNLLANATYVFRAYIIYTSVSTTPDFNMTFTGPAGSTINWTPLGVSTTATADDGTVRLSNRVGAQTRGIGTIAAVDMAALPQGIIIVGGTPGTLQFQWSQGTATAENTTVRANSWLYVERVA